MARRRFDPSWVGLAAATFAMQARWELQRGKKNSNKVKARAFYRKKARRKITNAARRANR